MRTGIVLAQLGGPADLDAVEPFIEAVFSDPAAVPLPGGPRARRTLGRLVARVRGRMVRDRYRQIGAGSPIGGITERQCEALVEELTARGHDIEVAVAMRHSIPDTSMAVARLMVADVDRIVLLPLYPQYSFATTGSAETELRRVLSAMGFDRPLSVIRSWCDHPAFLDATAGLVREALAEIPVDARGDAVVVASAHGLPERLVDFGDPYVEDVTATAAGLAERLGADTEIVVSYQSRTGPMTWTGPGTDEVLAELGAAGAPAVIVVPVSFVSDHLETLHEIDIELRELALEAGVGHFGRSPMLNDRAEVGPLLADIVEDHL
jgi:ferrochelatase